MLLLPSFRICGPYKVLRNFNVKKLMWITNLVPVVFIIQKFWARRSFLSLYSTDFVSPTGSGPGHGLNFILNSFEQVAFPTRSSKNFILSITNEKSAYDILEQNYLLEPGNLYTFRVMASQMVTNKQFDALSPGKLHFNLS